MLHERLRPYVQAINLETSLAVLSDSTPVDIIEYLDDDGNACPISEAVAFVAGNDDDGYYADAIDNFISTPVH